MQVRRARRGTRGCRFTGTCTCTCTSTCTCTALTSKPNETTLEQAEVDRERHDVRDKELRSQMASDQERHKAEIDSLTEKVLIANSPVRNSGGDSGDVLAIVAVESENEALREELAMITKEVTCSHTYM